MVTRFYSRNGIADALTGKRGCAGVRRGVGLEIKHGGLAWWGSAFEVGACAAARLSWVVMAMPDSSMFDERVFDEPMVDDRHAGRSRDEFDDQRWRSRSERVWRATPLTLGLFVLGTGASVGLGAPVLAGAAFSMITGLGVLLAAALI